MIDVLYDNDCSFCIQNWPFVPIVVKKIKNEVYLDKSIKIETVTFAPKSNKSIHEKKNFGNSERHPSLHDDGRGVAKINEVNCRTAHCADCVQLWWEERECRKGSDKGEDTDDIARFRG